MKSGTIIKNTSIEFSALFLGTTSGVHHVFVFVVSQIVSEVSLGCLLGDFKVSVTPLCVYDISRKSPGVLLSVSRVSLGYQL